MLQKLNRKLKGQSVAEYAILIGLVIAAAVAMQIYVKRTLQSRIHGGGKYLVNQTSTLDTGTTVVRPLEYQYEPYYLASDFNVERKSDAKSELKTGGAYEASSKDVSTRMGGEQKYTFELSADSNQ